MNTTSNFSAAGRFQAPRFAQSINTFRETGEFASDKDRVDLGKEDAQRYLDNARDSFSYWQSLDEGAMDMAKGRPGEVYLASDRPGEGTRVEFRGNAIRGEMMTHTHRPSTRYGATFASYTQFSPDSVDQITVMNNNEVYHNDSFVHVDYRISSDGPIKLGPGSTTVELKPRATGGYRLTSEGPL